MEEPEIISHLKQMDAQDPESWVFQSNEEHQEGVALLAQQFASAFGCGNMGYVIGRLHDKGKEQHAFQRYIRSLLTFQAGILYSRHTAFGLPSQISRISSANHQ